MIEITVETSAGKTYKMIVDLSAESSNTAKMNIDAAVFRIIRETFPGELIWNSFWNFINRNNTTKGK